MSLILEQMKELAACLCAEIADSCETEGAPGVCFCGILTGGEAYDASGVGDCAEDACGQAWVRLVNAYPAQAIGQQDVDPGNCNKTVGYDLEVGLYRCFPIEENGGSVTDEEMAEAVDRQIKDMELMRKAIVCCDALPTKEYVLGAYAPYGPLGGLVGGTWSLVLGGF